MSDLSKLYLMKGKELTFPDLTRLLDVSEGYARKIVADLVKKSILKRKISKKDRRYSLYQLNWVVIRQLIINGGPEKEKILNSLSIDEVVGLYVAMDDFEVIDADEDLQQLVVRLGYQNPESTVVITNVGTPTRGITLEI